MTSSAPLLELDGISKSFPGVHALRGVHLSLQAGRVLALLGANGAGKSTLIKTIGGMYLPDAGTVSLTGEPVSIRSPREAIARGIGIIHQEFQLVPSLTVRENLFLGMDHPLSQVRKKRERSETRAILKRLGVDIDPDRRCGSLTVAQQQLVEIAKAMHRNAKILIMDEPTAAISPHEADRLLDLIGELKSRGVGIIYVTHRLEEVFRVADELLIMRDGATVMHRATSECTREQLIQAMVGKEMGTEFPPRDELTGDVLLEVRSIGRGTAVNDVSLSLHQGEILGITGLVGAGRTELARLIFGADRADRGSLRLNGQTVAIHSPTDAIDAGICLLTEDRKREGLILGRSSAENFGLPNLDRFSRMGWLRSGAERARFQNHIRDLSIQLSSPRQRVGHLSGGNQQKVVLAKWLERHSKVLIFDEPTRGIDVGARREIYALMHRLADQGKGILMISSEFEEVMGMCPRILVMCQGRITGELHRSQGFTQEKILELAVPR